MTPPKESQGFSYLRTIIMKMTPIACIGLLIISLLSFPAWAQEQQIAMPYTLADRDRAIITETKIDALEAKVDLKFENQQRQLENLTTLFYWGFGILITLFMFMLGYMIWDRRTAMKPALEQASKALEYNRSFLTVLRDYSKKHPDLAEIMRTHGIL